MGIDVHLKSLFPKVAGERKYPSKLNSAHVQICAPSYTGAPILLKVAFSARVLFSDTLSDCTSNAANVP